MTGHDGTIKASYGDGDPIGGHNADREPIGFAQLSATYAGGAYTITPISGGTGISEPTLDGVSGDAPGGARGKCYALFRVGTTYYALVGEQPDWTDNDSDQFKNVRLWKSTNLIAWTRAGNVDWPLSGAAARNYAWKLPSSVGGDNLAPTRDGYFYFISAGSTAAPGDPGADQFLSSDNMILARAPDTAAAVGETNPIEVLANWEFLSGGGGASPPFWSNNFASRVAIPDLSGTLVNHWCNFIDYFPDIDRYILWRNRRSNPQLNTATATALEVLEAPHPWGKWTRIALFDPWQIPGNPATNRYIFTWTVPQLWASSAVVTGSTWTKDFILAYSGRRIVVDGVWDGLNTTTAQLSGTVAGPALTVPVNTALPTISPSGSVSSSTALTVSNGSWTNSPTTYSYQWLRGATNVGTNANGYTTVMADEGSAITCRVTAFNAAGSGTPVTSAAVTVEAVLDGAPPLPTNITSTQTVSPGVTSATINGFAANTKIVFNPGTYTNLAIVPKNGQWFQGEDGSALTTLTSNLAQQVAFSGGATDVFIQGLTIRDYSPGGMPRNFNSNPTPTDPEPNGAQKGAIEFTGDKNTRPDWTIYECKVTNNYGTGIKLSPGMWVSQTEVSNNGHCGLNGRGYVILVTDCQVFGNGRWHLSATWDNSAIKMSGGQTPWISDPAPPPAARGNVIRRCLIHDNDGYGVWTDWDVDQLTVERCSIYANGWGALSFEASARPWVHHCQLGDNLRRTPDNWLGSAELNWQATKWGLFEDNLVIVKNNVSNKLGQFTQNTRSASSYQGGIVVGHFTCTENRFERNVFVHLAGATAAAGILFNDAFCLQPIASCTDTQCLTECTVAGTNCRLTWPGIGVVPDNIGGNSMCFVPGASHNHLNVGQDNTYRATGTPPTLPTTSPWGSDTGQTFGGSPDSFIPDWTVLPTWTTPPGKV